MNQRLRPTLLNNKSFEFIYPAFTEAGFYFSKDCTNHYFYK